MDTDRWHCWGYTDHQGTLIISALIADHMTEPTSSALSVISDPLCLRDTVHNRSPRCSLHAP
ncbi:unnamed protein product [Staurois parvus]|uniref:Uncharacterized protein n=1 Tax=Staurois parvus TaxID=386267 RepID=A0ABN9EV82_9NEOB|nr:unnamed protein product [Staurois parvus]